MANDPTIEEAVARLAKLLLWVDGGGPYPYDAEAMAAQKADLRTLLASHASLEERVKEADLLLELVEPALERPLHNDLEVGFRHSPLTVSEKLERYQSTCFYAHDSVKAARSALAAFVNEKERT